MYTQSRELSNRIVTPTHEAVRRLSKIFRLRSDSDLLIANDEMRLPPPYNNKSLTANSHNQKDMQYYNSSQLSSHLEEYPDKINEHMRQRLEAQGYSASSTQEATVSAWRYYLESLKKKTVHLDRPDELLINTWDIDQWIDIASKYAFNRQFPVLDDYNQEKQVAHILAHLGQVSRLVVYGPFKIGGPEVSDLYIRALARLALRPNQIKAIYTVTFGETKGSPYFIRHQIWPGFVVNSISDIVEHTFFLTEKGRYDGKNFALAVGLIQWTATRGVSLVKGAVGSIYFGMELGYQVQFLIKDATKLLDSDSGEFGRAWKNPKASFEACYDAFFRKVVFGTGRDEAYKIERNRRLANLTKDEYKQYFINLQNQIGNA